MRREVRNITLVLAAIGVISILVVASAGAAPSRGALVALPMVGVLQVVLWTAIALFLVVQTVLTARTLRLLRQPGPASEMPAGPNHVALDVVWTVLPLVLAIGVGVYSYFWV